MAATTTTTSCLVRALPCIGSGLPAQEWLAQQLGQAEALNLSRLDVAQWNTGFPYFPNDLFESNSFKF
jgi:hypothetical protein